MALRSGDLPILWRRLVGRRDDEGRRLSSGSPYPLDRTDQRVLDPDFAGTIYTWDIDKTYLLTEFSNAVSLVKVALEFAIDKRAIPGTVPLLKGIRRGPGPDFRHTPLYFVSASPPQLRGVIERKMLIDGIQFDGITFKDQLALVRRGRLRSLREHIGYKLSGLLLYRRAHPEGSREILFGDDSESDAFIYSTYARVVSGELRGAPLGTVLRAEGVDPGEADYVCRLSDDLPERDAVRAIFIHLTEGRPPDAIAAQGPLVRACLAPFQSALALLEMGEIHQGTVIEVARSIRASGIDASEVLHWGRDAVRRGIVSEFERDRWLGALR
jgi:hypothetical protein